MFALCYACTPFRKVPSASMLPEVEWKQKLILESIWFCSFQRFVAQIMFLFVWFFKIQWEIATLLTHNHKVIASPLIMCYKTAFDCLQSGFSIHQTPINTWEGELELIQADVRWVSGYSMWRLPVHHSSHWNTQPLTLTFKFMSN